MHTPSRTALVVLSAVLLTQCQKNSSSSQPAVQTAALPALSWTQQLLAQHIAGGVNMPAAPFGIYVSNYLMVSAGTQVNAAKEGVVAGLGILLGNEEKPTATFALLQQLGIVLQVNIPDMLNRSTDRQQTLDTYIDTLTQVLSKSKAQVTALKQQQSDLLKVQHDKRSAVAAIQHDLNIALQKQDYTTASTKQSAIVDAKAEQSKAEAEVNQMQSTINLYTNLNNVGDKRLRAITANRLILIAGLQVVNVPGIDDLDILKKGTTTNSANSANPFGG